MATTAFLMFGEIWFDSSRILFSLLESVPIRSPLTSRTTVFLEARNWAKFSSAGRSEATAIIIPKTVETPARMLRPTSTSAKRSFFIRGLPPPPDPLPIAVGGGGGGGRVPAERRPRRRRPAGILGRSRSIRSERG